MIEKFIRLKQTLMKVLEIFQVFYIAKIAVQLIRWECGCVIIKNMIENFLKFLLM